MVWQVTAKKDQEVELQTMTTESTELKMPKPEQEFHRKVAAECFNRAWDYLEKKNRTSQDDQMMLNLAHASRYHWGLIGKPWNFTTGDWQISRVYAELNQPVLASDLQRQRLKYLRKTISQSVSFPPTKAWQEPMLWERNIRMPKSSSTRRATNCAPSV